MNHSAQQELFWGAPPGIFFFFFNVKADVYRFSLYITEPFCPGSYTQVAERSLKEAAGLRGLLALRPRAPGPSLTHPGSGLRFLRNQWDCSRRLLLPRGRRVMLCLVLMAVELVIVSTALQSANYTAYKPSTGRLPLQLRRVGPLVPFRHGRQARVAERKVPQAPGAPPHPAGPRATPGDPPRRRGPLSPPYPETLLLRPDPRASGRSPASFTPGLTRLRQLLHGFQTQV